MSSWYYPAPSLGRPTPACRRCYGNDPLAVYRTDKPGAFTCFDCCGDVTQALAPAARPSLTRDRIAADPLPSDDDVTAFHLLGRDPVSLSANEAAWLSRYAAGHALREAEAAAREADRPPPPPLRGAHVGEVGKRERLTVTVVSVREIAPHERFGRRFLVVMTDAATGGKVKWFTGEGLRLKEGRTYDVRATVKEHGEWNSERETLVNRVSEDDADTQPKEYQNDEG